MNTLRGRCLCGTVHFELDRVALRWLNHCHCTLCRKAGGGAFGSFLHARGIGFRWLAGEAAITRYESSPGNGRPFCARCGSRVPVLEAEDDGSTHVIVPAGLLDEDPGLRPLVHFHVASKAPWHAIDDALPQFEAFPPEAFWTAQGID